MEAVTTFHAPKAPPDPTRRAGHRDVGALDCVNVRVEAHRDQDELTPAPRHVCVIHPIHVGGRGALAPHRHDLPVGSDRGVPASSGAEIARCHGAEGLTYSPSFSE